MKFSNRRDCRRGASLPTVMMMVALMMTLAFVVLGIAFNHLNLSFRSSNNDKAELLAEAVLSLAIEKAYAAPETFGVTDSAAQQTIQLSFDCYGPDNRGVLSLDKATAASLGVPYSTNNRSESSVEGSNPRQSIPGQSLHLVARAEVGGAFSTMETIVQIPKFPYSIASGGAIRSNGGLLVASLRPGVGYDLSLPIHEQDLEPGSLVTNSKSGDDAIVMSGTNKIMGDLRSASGATIEADTQVLGKMRLNADLLELPDLHAYNYEPRPEDNPQTVNSGAGTLSVKGYNISETDLTVDDGINLKGGVLFVEGKLTVSAGGVTGKGAIIATEGITIYGGGEATSDNQAALISDGDITLKGTSTEKAKFSGLIYTKGNLNSENLRLAGVFVAGGADSEVTLKDTELYQVEEYAKLELTGPEFTAPNVGPPPTNFNAIPLEGSYDFSGVEANLTNYLNPNTGPGEPKYLFKSKLGSSYLTTKYKPDGSVEHVFTTGPDQYLLDGGVLGMKIFGTPVHSAAEAESVVLAEIQARYAADSKTLTAAEVTSVKNLARSFYESREVAKEFAIQSAVVTWEGSPGGGGTDPTKPFSWSLDMSQFISESQRMRVLYWAKFR